ncbi:MAG: NAD(P)/FAD-dependent oxidoreductase [Actinomycetia bacterium]|nr:NAD(P)/FAD-dependent oxidoreductase [Actinomycetes bacterium]
MSATHERHDTARERPSVELDAVIVGAGLAGLYMLHRLRELGLSVRVFEAGTGVGGTWYWNRYPGARCDVESMLYSYSWSDEVQQEWRWTSRYATQPEILRYVNDVADRFDLRRDIRFEMRVTAASFDEDTSCWQIRTDRGDRLSARFCVMATGCISHPQRPAFEGLDGFEGEWYHTGRWPKEDVDFTGKRVGVVGTGSTGIQLIPVVAKQAAHLTVFQRTPNFAIPAWDGPLAASVEREFKENYSRYRRRARETSTCWPQDFSERSALEDSPQQQERELEARWQEGGFGFIFQYSDILTDPEANKVAADFVCNKIRQRVNDPEIAELLCPYDHPLGTKRLCVDSDYYETYNRDNVTLVSIRETPIEAPTPTGLRTSEAEYDLDVIVFAIGFDSMTGALFNIDIRGRDGVQLTKKWADGPRTYLGIGTAGFPNLFTITGPGSPSVLSNMIVSIEQHVDWLTDCITHLLDAELDCIEPERDAEDAWVDHVNEIADDTLFPQADSWYAGANIAGKPRVFTPYVGGCRTYRDRCDEVAANGYESFTLR